MAIGLSSIASDDLGLDNPRPPEDAQEKEKEIVLVRWRDIIQSSDWTPASDISCPIFESIGWLVSKDDKEIKIGGTLVVKADDPQGTPFGITAFPVGCVEEIKPIL